MRRQLCSDLGWECLWTTAKVSSLALYGKCRSDSPAFAHARLSADPSSFAAGGWLAAVHRLHSSLHIPHWQPETDTTIASRKRSLDRYRKTVLQPSVVQALGSAPLNPALPWAWIALNADTCFAASAFTLWWQLRVLGRAHPTMMCPCCQPAEQLTRPHLESACPSFAQRCWTLGMWPEGAFQYPCGPESFCTYVNIVGDIQSAHTQAAIIDSIATTPSD